MKKVIITICGIGLLAIASVIAILNIPQTNLGGEPKELDECVSVMNKDDEFSEEERILLFSCLKSMMIAYDGYSIEIDKDELSIKDYATAYYQISEDKEIDTKNKVIKEMKKEDKEIYDNRVKEDKRLKKVDKEVNNKK